MKATRETPAPGKVRAIVSDGIEFFEKTFSTADYSDGNKMRAAIRAWASSVGATDTDAI